MKIDLLYELQVPKPWTTPQYVGEQRVFMHSLDQIERADALGFDTVWMVEHHMRDISLAATESRVGHFYPQNPHRRGGICPVSRFLPYSIAMLHLC